MSYPIVLGDPKSVEQIGEVQGLPFSWQFDKSQRLCHAALTRFGYSDFPRLPL